jgi:hypothetical protein
MSDAFRNPVAFVLAVLLAGPIAAAETGGRRIDMFHPPVGGPRVTWNAFHEDPAAKTDEVWHIGEDAIVCQGTPLGYLYTEQDFTDFVLRLEWRRPPEKAPGKGGVLIRTTGNHKIWPKSLEAQLNAGGAGDFWGLDGYRLTGPDERTKSLKHPQFGRLTNVEKTVDAEKPPGEWNTYQIIARGDVVTLILNGREVNRATGCDVVPGKICLTSEGDEIHFRNVRLEVIDGPAK